MRLEDCPRTVVIDGRRRRPEAKPVPRTREQQLEQEVAALRFMLGQARDVFRESVGCIVRMVSTPQRGAPVETIRRMREHGRAFLTAAGAQSWDRPSGVDPVPHREHRSWS